MSTPLSYAQVCAKENGGEIFQFDGLNMSKDLATALRSGKGQFTVHRQQLRATQEFLIEKLQSSAPMKSKDKSVFPIMEFPYDVRHLVLENMIEAQTLRVFLKHAAIPIALPHVARAGSSLLRRECLLVALKMSTIEVHSGPGNVALQAWLARIDFSGVETDSGNCQNGFDAINALSFPYFSDSHTTARASRPTTISSSHWPANICEP